MFWFCGAHSGGGILASVDPLDRWSALTTYRPLRSLITLMSTVLPLLCGFPISLLWARRVRAYDVRSVRFVALFEVVASLRVA
jgi:hypothetical protein